MQNGSPGSILPPPIELGPRLHHPSTPFTASLGVSSRVEGYDVARALAVLGMILVNGRQILLFSDNAEVAWFTRIADFLYGRPAVLFVILAGIGLSLMARRAIVSREPGKLAEVRASLWRRSIILYAMGMVFMRWWGADILHFYGVFLSTAALLLTVSGKRLWGMITLLLIASGVVFLLVDVTPPGLQHWLTRAGMAGDWLDDLFFDGNYPVAPWLTFLLIGLWLGRNEVFTNPAFRRVLVKGALITLLCAELLGRVGPWLLFHTFGFKEEGVIEMLVMLNPFPMTPLFSLSAISCAVLVLCVVLSGTFSFLPAGAWRILQNTGKLSLSIYISHIFFFLWLDSWLQDWVGFRAYPSLAVLIILVTFFVIPAAADVWIRNFGRGPLEWLLRKAAARLW